MSFARPRREHHALPNLGRLSLSVDTALPDKKCEARPATSVASLASAGPSVAKKAGASTTSVPTPTETFLECTSSEQVLPSLVSAPTPTSGPIVENYDQSYYEETDEPFVPLQGWDEGNSIQSLPDTFRAERTLGFKKNGESIKTKRHRHPTKEYLMVEWDGKKYVEKPCQIVGKYWEQVPDEERIERRYVADEGKLLPPKERINHDPENNRFAWFVYRINQDWLNGEGLFGDDPDIAVSEARKMMARRKTPRAGVNKGDKSLEINDDELENIVDEFGNEALLKSRRRAQDMEVYKKYANLKKIDLVGGEPTKEQMLMLAETPLRTGEILPMYGWQKLMWHYDAEYDGTERPENVEPNENNLQTKLLLKVTQYGVNGRQKGENPIDPMRKQERCFVQRKSQRFEDAQGNGAGDQWAEVSDMNLVPLNRYLLEDWKNLYNDSLKDGVARKQRLRFVERRKWNGGNPGQSTGSMDKMGPVVGNYDVLLFNLGPDEAPKLFAGRGGSEKAGISPDYVQVDRRKIVVKTMRGGRGIEEARGGRGRQDMRRGLAETLVDEAREKKDTLSSTDTQDSLLWAINTQRDVAEQNEKARITSLRKARQDITDDEVAAMVQEKGLQVALYVASLKPETLDDLVWRKEGFIFDSKNLTYKRKAKNAPAGSTKFANDEDETRKREVSTQDARKWPLLRTGDIRRCAAAAGAAAAHSGNLELKEDEINENDLVVKFFPTCPKFAYDQDTPFMDGQLKGRDLDVRNRPYYAKSKYGVSSPNPQQVPSVWKVADFRNETNGARADKKGMAEEWKKKRLQVSTYLESKPVYENKLEAAYKESDKKYEVERNKYVAIHDGTLARYTTWYAARPFYNDTAHKVTIVDIQNWEDWDELPDYLPLFGITDVQDLDDFSEEDDTVKILPLPENITDPGNPVWTLGEVPNPPKEPMVRGGWHAAGPGGPSGVTDTKWMDMPLNVFEDNVFTSMWNHLTNVGMYTPEEKVDVPRHINAGYTSETGPGTGKKDEQNNAFCVGYAIYKRSTFEEAMQEDRDYVARASAFRAANEASAQEEHQARLAQTTRAQQMSDQRRSDSDRAAAMDVQLEKLAADQAKESEDAEYVQKDVAKFREDTERRVEDLIDLDFYDDQTLPAMLGPEKIRWQRSEPSQKWPLLGASDRRRKLRPDKHLLDDMSTNAWYEEWLDCTTDLRPVPNPLLYDALHTNEDYEANQDLLMGLNCPNGIRYEAEYELTQRERDWEQAEREGKPHQPWFPERHEANYKIYAKLAGKEVQMQCDTVLAGSRGYSQPDEYTQDAAGKSGWQRRLDIANKYEAAVTEETLSADIMDRMTERDHRRAYRDFLKLMEDSLDPEDSEDDEMLPVDDTASVHSEHLERLHFHVLGDSHRASPSAARELASAVCGLTEREYKVLYDRLLPNEQRAMNLLRDQLV